MMPSATHALPENVGVRATAALAILGTAPSASVVGTIAQRRSRAFIVHPFHPPELHMGGRWWRIYVKRHATFAWRLLAQIRRSGEASRSHEGDEVVIGLHVEHRPAAAIQGGRLTLKITRFAHDLRAFVGEVEPRAGS